MNTPTPILEPRPDYELTIAGIARVCHEANRAYCLAIGDNSISHWADAPDWQTESACKGVVHHLKHPGTTPQQSHESWLETKRRDGWTYGPLQDADKKQHPCFMPYDGLPIEQRIKDELFTSIINALRPIAFAKNLSPH